MALNGAPAANVEAADPNVSVTDKDAAAATTSSTTSATAPAAKEAATKDAAGPVRLATLYVGDLAPDTSEPALFEFFSKYGQVVSVRVCRDMHTQASLGYGYVNYQNSEDATRVIDTLNYTPLRPGGRPMRIMWYQRDPTLRKNGQGNVFVKDVNKDIDDKSLAEIFSVFGPILSAKVSRDREGKSNGYGFVHFEREEDAKESIAKMNGMQLNGVKVYVGLFKRRRERYQEMEKTFSNVFFRNLAGDVTEEKFVEFLGKWGTVVSACLKKNEKFTTQFGFGNFETHEAALKCIEECNGTVFAEVSGTEPLYAGRAMKERERQVTRQIEESSRRTERQIANLYIKNIPDFVDDEKLRELFSSFGEITSACVQRDANTKLSKGFGFVCYKTKEGADKAVAAMNGKIMDGKPLYVTYHQTQDQRRRQLEQRRANPNTFNRWAGFHPQQGQQQPVPPSMPALGGGGYPYGSNPWAQPPMMGGPQGGGYYNRGGPMGGGGMMMGGRNQQRNGPMGFGGNQRGGQRGGMMMGGGMGVMGGRGPFPQQGQQGMMMGAPGGMPMGRPGVPAMPMGGGVPPQMGGLKMPPQQQMMIPQQQMMMQQQAQRFPAQQPQPQPQAPAQPAAGAPAAAAQQQPKNIPGSTLTSAALAAMSSEEQKNALGERLYSRICAAHPEQAAKITGMLLEMDTTEILNVLEDNAVLSNKISEAITVLRAHTEK